MKILLRLHLAFILYSPRLKISGISGCDHEQWRENDQLSTKGQVLGLALGEEARAYPLEMLAEVPVVNDQLGGEGVVLVSTGVTAGDKLALPHFW